MLGSSEKMLVANAKPSLGLNKNSQKSECENRIRHQCVMHHRCTTAHENRSFHAFRVYQAIFRGISKEVSLLAVLISTLW
jgi:hypothetical protein